MFRGFKNVKYHQMESVRKAMYVSNSLTHGIPDQLLHAAFTAACYRLSNQLVSSNSIVQHVQQPFTYVLHMQRFYCNSVKQKLVDT